MIGRGVLCLGALLVSSAASYFAPAHDESSATAAPREAAVGRAQAAGSAACKSCHPTIHAAWESSHHGRTAQPVATPPGGADLAIGSSWVQVYLRKDESGLHRLVPECFDLRERRWRDVEEVLDAIRGPLMPEEGGPAFLPADPPT